ncbi:MAG: DUF4034 domain-containing protein, partial [Acidobacteria bacterium]|nr:DUF4034 domain-containing protein [Acidobacteriota bacterium]
SAFELFRSRLRSAIDELLDAQTLGGSECPEWNRLMMEAEASYSEDRKTVDHFFEAGFRIDPTYYQLTETRAFYLQPKWGGRPGEFEQFIAHTCDRVEGDEGKILYFEVVSGMQPDLRGDILRTGLSWQRTKEGYALLKEHYGTDRFRRNMFFYLSSYGNDVPTMTAASDDVGDEWDHEVWIRRDTFDMMKKAVAMMKESKARTGQEPGGFSRN